MGCKTKTLASISIIVLMILTGLSGVVRSLSNNSLDVEVEISDTSVNVGEKVIFHVIIRDTQVSSLGTHSSYKYKIEMKFGDGTPNVVKFTDDKESYISHVYNKAGTFLPKIRVEDLDSGDEVSKDLEYIRVSSSNIEPRARIELSKNVIKVGESITFDASKSYDPDGRITSYIWSFGDGKKGYGKIVNHQYREGGVYEVTLTVKDNDGASDSAVTWVRVVENDSSPFDVVFSVNDYSIEEGEKITVYARVVEGSSLAMESDSSLYKYTFYWGDGEKTVKYSDKEAEADHIYNEAGNYKIYIEVEHDGYTVRSDYESIEVREKVLDFEVEFDVAEEKQTYMVGESIEFNIEIKEVTSLSSEHHSFRYFYSVDFDDGSPNVVGYTDGGKIKLFHSYSYEGEFTPEVKVKSRDGKLKEEKCRKITVVGNEENQPPVANAGGIYISKSRLVKFDASLSYDPDGEIVKYIWNFGDGSTKVTKKAVTFHLYKEEGVYTVTLKVVDDKGAESVDTAIVRIGEEKKDLDVRLSLDKTEVKEGETIEITVHIGSKSSSQLYVTSILSVEKMGRYAYKISFGDGTGVVGATNSDTIYLSHAYSRAGEYKIHVEVTDSEENICGEASAMVKVIQANINHPPVAIGFAEDGVVGEPLLFDASQSYDPDGDRIYYRWDFDNDGIYDTQWIETSRIRYTYYEEYDGFARLQVKDEKGATDEKLVKVIVTRKVAATTLDGEEDQKQEIAEDYVKIYGGKKYAQTFTPTMLNLTGIKIYVGRKGIASYESKGKTGFVSSLMYRLRQALSRFFGGKVTALGERIEVSKRSSKANVNSMFLGDLFVYIYKYKNGNPEGELLTYVKLSPDDVSKSGSWVSIDLKGIILAKNLEEWGTYYSIVLYHSGGNPRNYYKWYYAYNDPYPNGTFYYYEGGRWKEDVTRDFAFVTYGKPTGDEPDGVEERWAVLLAGPNCPIADIDVEIMRDVLEERGWDSRKITVIHCEHEPKDAFWDALKQMAENEDMDDICLIGMSMHSGFIHYGSLDKELDDLGFACKGMLILISSCGSGAAISYLAQPKRVIITSCKADEKTGGVRIGNKRYGGWLFYFLADQTGAWSKYKGYPPPDPIVGYKDGAFARTDPDTSDEYGGNNDGWISAEEAYPFVCKWLGELTKDYPPEAQPHPQIYDGYPGDLKVVKWREE